MLGFIYKYMAEDTRKILEEFRDETIRHFDIVTERMEEKIQILAEQVAANTVKLEGHDQRFEKIDQRFEKIDQRFDQIDQRFDQIDQRFEKIEGDLTIIKTDLGSIKQDLKRKVSYDEFAALEKRVISLESKTKC
jgi:predicted  nucleic acid-binding Zn-ribbon protein